MKIISYLIVLLYCTTIFASTPSDSYLKFLYNSLDPHSVSQHLAYYQLYKDTPQGKEAYKHLEKLLTSNQANLSLPTIQNISIEQLSSLITMPSKNISEFDETTLSTIEILSSNLANRSLPGYNTFSINTLDPYHDIDLSRGLLLSYNLSSKKIRQIEAALDFMALQIRAHITPDSSTEEKIMAINDFIFKEMHFQFPPKSIYEENIDHYTFISDVMDSRQGVCLGISIIYYCLAQRLDLSLIAITPPGHIFLRYPGENPINIETTARGINLPDKRYTNFSCNALPERTTYEMIGLAHFNQAAQYLQQGKYEKALKIYLKAKEFLPEDIRVQEFIAYCYIIKGQRQKGVKILKDIAKDDKKNFVRSKDLDDDLIQGLAPTEGLKAIFSLEKDSRQDLLRRKDQLESILKKHPKFRSGLLSLAFTWLELSNTKNALYILQQYHSIDPSNPSVEYLLTHLNIECYDYKKAWKHLKILEELSSKNGYHTDELTNLRKILMARSPIKEQ